MIVVSDKLFNETPGLSYTIEVIDVKNHNEEKLNRLIRKRLKGDWDFPIHYKLAWKNKQIIGEVSKGEGSKKRIRQSIDQNIRPIRKFIA